MFARFFLLLMLCLQFSSAAAKDEAKKLAEVPAVEPPVQTIVVTGKRLPKSTTSAGNVGDTGRSTATVSTSLANLSPSLDFNNPLRSNNSNPNSTNPVGCNPVVYSTGEKLLSESDFIAEGLYGLSQTRHYRSAPVAAGHFGPGWYSSLLRPELALSGCYLDPNDEMGGCIPTQVGVYEPDGSSTTWHLLAGGTDGWRYVGPSNVGNGRLILEYADPVNYTGVGNFVRTIGTETHRYSYWGQILSIENLSNSKLVYTHSQTWPSFPLRVTNTSGQYVEFV